MDEATIQKLKDAGLLKGKFDDYRRIFNLFKIEHSKTGSKMTAYTNVSITIGYSEDTVQRAVKVFENL